LSAIKLQPHAAILPLCMVSSANGSLSLLILAAVINLKKFVFIPAAAGQPPPGDLERNLLALSARLGGMGITNPVIF